jgi:hypothetical protein
MTHEAWFAAINPGPLLVAIQEATTSGISPPATVARRLRLFACAATRQVWDLLSNDARSAIYAAERYANGRALSTDLLATALTQRNPLILASQLALGAAQAATGLAERWGTPPNTTTFSAPEAALYAARAVATREVGPAPPGRPTTPLWHTAWTSAFAAARLIQADYVRDIFPPPDYAPRRDPSWCSSTVLMLAHHMEDSGDFSAVPILADALQDAGCEDEVLLSGCRTRGSNHVRGNWVVDLVLDRL